MCCKRLTETVHDHAADQIFRIRVHSGARVRADVRFRETSYHQAQIVAGSDHGGHVRTGTSAIYKDLMYFYKNKNK